MPPGTTVPSRATSTPLTVGPPHTKGPATLQVRQRKTARVLLTGLVVTAIFVAWLLLRPSNKPPVPTPLGPALEGGRSSPPSAGPPRKPITSAPTNAESRPQKNHRDPPAGLSPERPRKPLSKSEALKQLAAVRKKAERIRENAYAFVRGSEAWVINEARAAYYMLEEADLQSIAGKEAATEAEARRLREQAIENLKACARQFTHLIAHTEDKERLRTLLAVTYKEIADAYEGLGRPQEALKYRSLAELN